MTSEPSSRRASLVLISVCFVIAYSALDVVRRREEVGPKLGAIASEVLADVPGAVARLREARAGEQEALPRPVLAMTFLLEKHDVAAYDVSPRIQSSPLIYQRLVEGAWPRRRTPGAEIQLWLASEWETRSGEPGCRSIDSMFLPDPTMGVVLARCR